MKVYFTYENGMDGYTECDCIDFVEEEVFLYFDGEHIATIPIEKMSTIEN